MWTFKRARVPVNYRIPALVVSGAVIVGALLVGYYSHEQKPPTPTKKVEAPVVLAPKPACVAHNYTATAAADRKHGLTGIADREWGGRDYFWPVLAEVNGIKGPDYKIFAGQVLLIPCLCDLPALAKKPVVAKKVAKKTTTPKVPSVSVTVVSIPVQTPAIKPAPCSPCEGPAPKPVVESPTTAPKPPPAQSVSVPAVAPPAPQQAPAPPAPVAPQTQQNVVVNVQQPPAAPAPTPQPTAPQPVAPPAPTPTASPATVPKKEFVPPPAKPTAEVKPPVIPIPQPPNMVVGSVWNSFGQNPIEPGNFVNYSHADIGAVIGTVKKVQVEPYVGLNFVEDTKGYSWNNRAEGEVGLKLVRSFSHGSVEVGTAYAAERRFGAGLPAQTKSGLIDFTNGWFGGDQPTNHESKRQFLPGTLPWTFQWRIGNISPFERNNLIGVLRFDQGFTLAKVKGISLIPTAMMQFGFDTDNHPWNNRYSYGAMMKIAGPWKSGTVSVSGGYLCAKQYAGPVSIGTPSSYCGPGISLDFYAGLRKKIGGK